MYWNLTNVFILSEFRGVFGYECRRSGAGRCRPRLCWASALILVNCHLYVSGSSPLPGAPDGDICCGNSGAGRPQATAVRPDSPIIITCQFIQLILCIVVKEIKSIFVTIKICMLCRTLYINESIITYMFRGRLIGVSSTEALWHMSFHKWFWFIHDLSLEAARSCSAGHAVVVCDPCPSNESVEPRPHV